MDRAVSVAQEEEARGARLEELEERPCVCWGTPGLVFVGYLVGDPETGEEVLQGGGRWFGPSIAHRKSWDLALEKPRGF